MERKPNNPVVVSVTGLIGLLGIAWLCDGLVYSFKTHAMQTFALTYFVIWLYALIALLLAAVWLLLAWYVLIRAPRNTWVSLGYLLVGLFIVAYPALVFTPALCCWIPYIGPLQITATGYLFFSGSCVAVIGLAGVLFRRRKSTQG